MDETALIQLAQNGSTDAFKALFEGHQKKIFSLAFCYLRNAEDAEDVLQMTFTKAYYSLRKFRPGAGTSFLSWLNRICINSSIDMIRRSRNPEHQSVETREMENLPCPAPSSNPLQHAQNEEIRKKIDHTLNRLSPRQRIIFILRHYQEFSTREIAEYMNSSEGSVKRQLFRAVAVMKKHLKKYVLEKSYGL